MKRLQAVMALTFFLWFQAIAQSIVVNPDGTHSMVINSGGNTSTIVNANGTHSTLVTHGNTGTIVNPDGTHSTVVTTGNTSTIFHPNGTHSIIIDSVTSPGESSTETDSIKTDSLGTRPHSHSIEKKTGKKKMKRKRD